MNLNVKLQHYHFKLLKVLGLNKKYQYVPIFVIVIISLLSLNYLFKSFFDEVSYFGGSNFSFTLKEIRRNWIHSLNIQAVGRV